MFHSRQPLCDAIIDSSGLSLLREKFAAEKPSQLSVFSAQFLGERDILQELHAAEQDFIDEDLDSCERRLLCLQAHVECLFPGNNAGIASIFLCLGLVKHRQDLFYHSFGYLLHALSILEQGVGSVNALSVLILRAIRDAERKRSEDDRAELADLLARIVMQRFSSPIPETLTVWEYLRSQEIYRRTDEDDYVPKTLEEAYAYFRNAVHAHGMASLEAATAATKLGVLLYAERHLLEARRYLERGITVRRHSENADINEIADIYDLLVTICEELNDPPASDQFRTRSRMLRMCATMFPRGIGGHHHSFR